MYFLYSVLLASGVIALLPRFILDAARHGKYAAGFSERTGRLPIVESGGRPVIWLHCVSVGETQAARPLVNALLDRYPSHALVISTTTLTGQRLAREVFGRQAALIFYFPFDWAWTVRRALRAINPSVVLILETELWPNFLRQCRARRTPVALVNGRISENSFRRYRRIRRFIGRVVNDLSLAIMQTDADAARIRALGLAEARIKVSGNIKFDISSGTGEQALTGEIRERFRLADGRPLLVAASTHAPEERIVLEAFRHVRGALGEKRPRLLIAPRHPERFAEVSALLEASGLSWARRSTATRSPSPDAGDSLCEVILLDTIGELRAVYPLAALVFIGGSIAPTGGHNVLEPAEAARCIITGAHTSNFSSIVGAFLEQGAIVQLPPVTAAEAPGALANVLKELLSDDDRRRHIGDQARAVLEHNRGATMRTIELLAPHLIEKLNTEYQLSDLGVHAPTRI